MIRGLLPKVWLMGVVICIAVPAMARHEDDELAPARRELADAKQRRDEFVARVISADPQLLAARAGVGHAQARFDQLRDRFSLDLERHPQLNAAQEAVARADSALRRPESDLAALHERRAALRVPLEAQQQALAGATHQLQHAEGEIIARQRELDQASPALYLAQSQLSRAAEHEQQARAARDRDARRVAHLENIARIDDHRAGGRRFRDD